jgi:hypothetical protein
LARNLGGRGQPPNAADVVTVVGELLD